MTITNKTICCALALFLTISCSLRQQKKSPQEMQESCRNFVQEFYNWYVAKSDEYFTKTPKERENEVIGSDLVLKYKKDALSPELYRELKEYSDAEAKSTDEMPGLDFDPFLAGQDNRPRYIVGNITVKGDRYWVEVGGIGSGRNEKPDLTPELMLKDGKWIFVNFHYNSPEGAQGDLLSFLKDIREGREKDHK